MIPGLSCERTFSTIAREPCPGTGWFDLGSSADIKQRFVVLIKAWRTSGRLPTPSTVRLEAGLLRRGVEALGGRLRVESSTRRSARRGPPAQTRDDRASSGLRPPGVCAVAAPAAVCTVAEWSAAGVPAKNVARF